MADGPNGWCVSRLKNRQHVVPLTRQECQVPLRIKRHPMISKPAAHRVLADDHVRGRINHGQDILVLQIDVHLARDRSYCGYTVSLSKCSVSTIRSFAAVHTASALPRSSDT